MRAATASSARNLWRLIEDDVAEFTSNRCVSPVSPALSRVGGPGKRCAIACTKAHLTLVAVDAAGDMLPAGGSPWSVSLKGAGRTCVDLTDNQDGTHEATYTCSTSGAYKLQVRLGPQLVHDGHVLVSNARSAPRAANVRSLIRASAGEERHTQHGLFARWVVATSLSALKRGLYARHAVLAHSCYRQRRTREVFAELRRISSKRAGTLPERQQWRRRRQQAQATIFVWRWRRHARGLRDRANGWIRSAVRSTCRRALRSWLRMVTSDAAALGRTRGPSALMVAWLGQAARVHRTFDQWRKENGLGICNANQGDAAACKADSID